MSKEWTKKELTDIEIGIKLGDMNGEWQASKDFLKKLEKTAPKRKQPDKLGRRPATPVEIRKRIKKNEK